MKFVLEPKQPKNLKKTKIVKQVIQTYAHRRQNYTHKHTTSS